MCVCNERDLLGRLLQKAERCYDDLVVVHDGEDPTNVRSLVEAAGGRFYERRREHQQEPHWPFAWERAAHDWILRLDADEFPSDEMKQWLKSFRREAEPDERISGYTCVWPLWNGRRTVSRKWPSGRMFLFHRQRVRFFGIVEQVPLADGKCHLLDILLHHQPRRKSYGLHNVLLRKQAYQWRAVIAQSLLGKPGDLNCWRWGKDAGWPPRWEEIRQRPVRTFLSRLVMDTLRTLRDQWKSEGQLFPGAAINGPIHHALICLEYWRLRRRQENERCEKQAANKSE